MKKKTVFGLSLALAAAIVAGQMAAAAGSDEKENATNPMVQMMENGNMNKMMNAMNSPEGQEMTKACGKFMDSFNESTDGAKDQQN
ncbi:hypothetical protein [Effusibacillus consociatus]|uniref:Uncharacterized protein n=1 Tax=Effusibacillus consociatus TaxID=1117041 RepID=A0ABV9PXL3_9BACL